MPLAGQRVVDIDQRNIRADPRQLVVRPAEQERVGLRVDREALRAALRRGDENSNAPLYLVYLGHGTSDGSDAALNLVGPDVRASELALWLDPVERPTAVLICAAASGPFLTRLSKPGRVVVTAARSGRETSFARFGDALSTAIAEPEADLDGDRQVSLLEAFLVASRRTAAFYEEELRLASEHALLDDDGNGRGTPAGWYRGLELVERPADEGAADGLLAHRFVLVPSAEELAIPDAVRARRDALERELAGLRQRKGTLAPEAYESELERVLLALARLYRDLEGTREDPGAGG